MTYATQQNLTDRFGETELLQLADRDDDGAVDAAIVAAALGEADALIDSYVGRRYDLPLASVPPVLTNLACAIARHLLHKDFPTEAVRKAYEDALRVLREISTGTAVLDVGGSEPAGNEVVVLTDGPDKVFGRDALKGF